MSAGPALRDLVQVLEALALVLARLLLQREAVHDHVRAVVHDLADLGRSAALLVYDP